MQVFKGTLLNQSRGRCPVKPPTGGVLPEHERASFVSTFVVFALVGQRVFHDVPATGRAGTKTLLLEIERIAVMVPDPLNHGLCLLDDLVHVGLHRRFATLNGQQGRFHVTC